MPQVEVVMGTLKWDDKQGRWIRWSGRQWAKALYSATPSQLALPEPLESSPPLDEQRRQRIFKQAVDAEVLAGGTVVQLEALTAVLSHRRPVNHVLHFVLLLLTLGGWSIVWLIMAIARKDERFRLDVDPWGHVWPTETPK